MIQKLVIHQLESSKEELSYIYDDLSKRIPEEIKDYWMANESNTFLEKLYSINKDLDDLLELLENLKEKIKNYKEEKEYGNR